MNADGTNQVRLTNNSVVDDDPTWSPDGTKIAFVSETTADSPAIFTMDADGTDSTEVTTVNYFDRYDEWPILDLDRLLMPLADSTTAITPNTSISASVTDKAIKA